MKHGWVKEPNEMNCSWKLQSMFWKFVCKLQVHQSNHWLDKLNDCLSAMPTLVPILYFKSSPDNNRLQCLRLCQYSRLFNWLILWCPFSVHLQKILASSFNTSFDYDEEGILKINFSVLTEEFWRHTRPCYVKEVMKILNIVHAILLSAIEKHEAESVFAGKSYSQK